MKSTTPNRSLFAAILSVAVLALGLTSTATHAANDCANVKSFSDPCWAKGQEATTQDFRKPAAKPAATRKAGSSRIPLLGKTADGKYDIYGFDEVHEDFYRVGNTLYHDKDVTRFVKPVQKADIGKTVFCPDDLGLLCKDKAGHIVGTYPVKYPK